MIIENNIESKIKSELIDAKSFWIATAMISNNGWDFIQKANEPLLPGEIEEVMFYLSKTWHISIEDVQNIISFNFRRLIDKLK